MHYIVDENERVNELKHIDMEQVKDLWYSCFHDTKSFMEYYFSLKTKDNKIFGNFEDQKLVSMLHLNPYEIQIGKRNLRSYYIVGVATYEAYRKQGRMRKLLAASMNQMHKEGVPFAYLMPAKEAIYLPFDFRIITTQKRRSMLLQEMDQVEQEAGLHAAQISGEDGVNPFSVQVPDSKEAVLLGNLAEYTNQHLERTEDVFTIRNVAYYQRLIHELNSCNGKLVTALYHNEVVGYAAYVVEEGNLVILEQICNRAYEQDFNDALYEIVKQQITAEDYKEDAVLSIAPPIMARLINVREFLLLLRSKQSVLLNIKVEDPMIPDNNGIFSMECMEDECAVTKLSASEYDDITIDLSMDIATLTRLFFGQIPANELKQMISSKETMDKLNAIHMLSKVHINEIV